MFCRIFQTASWIPPNGGEKLGNPAQDDFYGRTNWGVTVAAWDICIFFDLTHRLFWNYIYDGHKPFIWNIPQFDTKEHP